MLTDKSCPLVPKQQLKHYFPQGSGRDLYINHPENSPRLDVGIIKNPIHYSNDFKLYSSPKRVDKIPDISKFPMVVNYHCDGRGRDAFIGKNNGGFEKLKEELPNFFKQLRVKQYDKVVRKKYTNVEFEKRINSRKVCFTDEPNKKVNLSEVLQRLIPAKEKNITPREDKIFQRYNRQNMDYINFSEEIKRTSRDRIQYTSRDQKYTPKDQPKGSSRTPNMKGAFANHRKIKSIIQEKDGIFNDYDRHGIFNSARNKQGSVLKNETTHELIKLEYIKKLSQLKKINNRTKSEVSKSSSVPKQRVILEKIEHIL